MKRETKIPRSTKKKRRIARCFFEKTPRLLSRLPNYAILLTLRVSTSHRALAARLVTKNCASPRHLEIGLRSISSSFLSSFLSFLLSFFFFFYSIKFFFIFLFLAETDDQSSLITESFDMVVHESSLGGGRKKLSEHCYKHRPCRVLSYRCFYRIVFVVRPKPRNLDAFRSLMSRSHPR